MPVNPASITVIQDRRVSMGPVTCGPMLSSLPVTEASLICRFARLDASILNAIVVGVVVASGWPESSLAQSDSTGRRAETYQSASIDAAGRLVIIMANGRTVVVRKEGDQSSFAEPVLSPDRTAVGAQAEFPNCCTSYDIPLQLVVYARGKVHRFTGSGLPIFQWQFADGGRRVAFGQEPVHFGCSIHYELRDIDSERLIDSADIPEPCGLDLHPKIPKTPAWVQDLLSKK